MKPGFKFFGVAAAAVTLLSCSLCGVSAISGYKSDVVTRTIGVFGVLNLIGGTNLADAFPPLPQKRLGSPTPQIGGSGKFSTSFEDEDSDEEEDDLLESGPRSEPKITPSNRDQCLARLLCGFSVPVTGGASKKNYYSEYAQIVSKYFEAFPLDDEYQSKESMELYDDYSNEDDKPTRYNSKRKPLNSSRVEATAPTLQLFDLALVDVTKPEDLDAGAKKNAIDKVFTGNRIARARKIVENIGQKLQTVRQCQSINGCPFTFKQLREKLKKKEAQRVNSNVPLPGPIWPKNPNRRDPTPPPNPYHQAKPKPKPQNRPIPPTQKPEPLSVEGLFSDEEPIFPFKDANKGDDELEELFGPAKVKRRPGQGQGFHQGVDDNYHYEYNPDKPWRPGGGNNNGGNSYGVRPWKPKNRPNQNQNHNQYLGPPAGSGPGPNNRNRPQQQQQQQQQQRPPVRPGLRPAGPPRAPTQKKTPGAPPKNRPFQPKQQKRPETQAAAAPPAPVSQPPRTPPPAPVTTSAPFPKKKISYVNTQVKKPVSSNPDDDEDSEDNINKVAPVELVGNGDAGEREVKASTTSTTTTEKPSADDSDEYDDDDGDYYEGGDYDDDDDDEDEDDAQDDEDDDNYSDEEEDDKKEEKKAEEKKKKRKQALKEKRKKKKNLKKEAIEKAKETAVKVEEAQAPKNKVNKDPFFDDESDDVNQIWTKLNFATTGANYKAPEKVKKKDDKEEATTKGSVETVADDAEEESDEDDEESDDEAEGKKGSLTTLTQKVRASSTSTSASDEDDDDDDEVDDEIASKGKKPKRRTKEKPKKEEKGDKLEINDDETNTKTKSKDKDSKKSKKKGSKNKAEDSEEKEERGKWKQVMMQIGGRPLVPKPEVDTSSNSQKTSGLVSNRFKLQFINPYGPAPPQHPETLDGNHHAPYQPMRATPPPSSGMGGLASALPFKLNMNMNAGPLGAFTGGSSSGSGNGGPPEGHGHGHNHGGMGPGPSGPGHRGSIEFSEPSNPHSHHHQGPPPNHNQPSPYMSHQQHYPYPPSGSGPSGGTGGGGTGLSGSSLFKLNPLPALSSLFKRPSSSSSQSNFDPMTGGGGGHNGPPMNAFVHRPIGPESSSYRREQLSPASGSSNKKASKKGTKSKAKKSKTKLF